MNKHKGVTLIELMVAMASFMLLAVVIAMTLSLSLKYWKVIDTKAEVQLNAMIGIDALKYEVSQSKIGSFTVNSASYPRAISFQSAMYNQKFYTTSDGSPSWMTYVVYYLQNGSENLIRREIYLPGAIAPLSAPTLISYCDGTGTIKAIDVNDFVPALGVNYVDLYVKTRLDYGSENSTTLSNRIYPRN